MYKLFFVLFLLYPFYAVSTIPGFKIRITQRGFDYANDVGIEILHQSLRRSHLSNLNGESGSLSYEIKNLLVRDFPKPQSTIKINSGGSGLLWKASGIKLSIHADWDARLKKGWVDVSDDDSLDAFFDDTSFSLGVSIDHDYEGHPKITPIGCNCYIGSLELQINGGSGWVYEFFINLFKDKIKEYFQRVICDALQGIINNDAQRFLSELPVTVDIDNKYTLDYRIISKPMFTPGYMETYHKGHVYWKNNADEAPSTVPVIIYSEDGSSKMLYLDISEYMFNSLLYQAYNHDVLNYKLTKNELPDDYKGVLHSSCIDFNCIGIVIPQISEKFPDRNIELYMKSIDSPRLRFNTDGIWALIKGNIEVFAVTTDGSTNLHPEHLMTIDADISTKVALFMQNEKLHAKVGSLAFKVSTSYSTVGDINHYRWGLCIACNTVCLFYLHLDMGKKGFPLPASKNMKFVNTELVTREDSLLIATDVEYVPDEKIVNERRMTKDEL